MISKNPVILIIRDGWGYSPKHPQNAILSSKTPFTDELMSKWPNTLVEAAGAAVGLENGYQGNSEVGHLTMGSGRVIEQPFIRINRAIQDKSFFEIPEFLQAIENCRANNSALHLMGLLQSEAVHSDMAHLFALLDLCARQNFHNVFIHAILDGRDAPVRNGANYIDSLEKKLKESDFGQIATLSGRFYAMDRDMRWERVRAYYDCIVNAQSENNFESASQAVAERYNLNETDEFIKPARRAGYAGIKPRDSVIFFNFRTDRTREITRALVEKDFAGWAREPLDIFFVAMTQYYSPMNGRVAFPEKLMANLLGEILSKNNLRQLRISETEKYAHVTFFFNGQREEPFANEDRILINSPKVSTYDMKPEMSAKEIVSAVNEKIAENSYDFIAVNLVNCDMVGHTGNFEAIKKAVETVDQSVGSIVSRAMEYGYNVIITADHGNAEDKSSLVQTSHTTNPVPLILVSPTQKFRLKNNGGLKDIAPTILDIMSIAKPKDMTGETLIER